MTYVTNQPAAPAAALSAGRRNPFVAALAVLALDRTAMIGGLIILAFVVIALFVPWIAPFEPTEQHILDSLQPPSATYWLGTDEYGRDLFSRALYGTLPEIGRASCRERGCQYV